MEYKTKSDFARSVILMLRMLSLRLIGAVLVIGCLHHRAESFGKSY